MNISFMNIRALILLSLFSFALPGCTLFNYQDPQLSKKIDGLLVQHEYQIALNKLSNVTKEHPDYKELMKKKQLVLKAASDFETSVQNKAQQQVSDDLWHDAEQTYQYGIDKYSESKKLNNAYKEFLSERKSYQEELRFQLLINQAESLIKNSKLQKELFRVTPDDRSVRNELEDHKDATEQIHADLLFCGK